MARERRRCPNCKVQFRTAKAGKRTCPRCLDRQRELQAAMTAIQRVLSLPPPPQMPRVFRVLEGD